MITSVPVSVPAATEPPVQGLSIGFIGLGDQGGPMAEMIVRAGWPTTVWARRAVVRERFADLGATIASDPATLGRTCDVVCLCVTDDAAIRELAYDGGLLREMRPGATLVIHSTIRPQTCRDLASDAAARGVAVLDAPVSGSAARALARSLLVIIGGDEATLARVRPVIESYGDPIMHVGAVGAAMTAKLINNLMAAVNYATAYDALALARDNGIDTDLMCALAASGSGRNYGFELMPRAHRADRSGHISRILGKDVELAIETVPGLAGSDLAAMARRAIVTIAGFGHGKGRIVSPQPD